ncbi:MAG: hypothetical protein GXY34_06315 [Syntrophomonadaceae bacterium]|nr:hypothetical protein [Syntrophomonadaceae bacterium]
MKKTQVYLLLTVLLITMAGCLPTGKAADNIKPSPKSPAVSAPANKAPDLRPYLATADSINLAGVINIGYDKFDIHMDLKPVAGKVPGLDKPEYLSSLLITTGQEEKRYTGQYYYDRAKTPLQVEALLYQSGYLAIVEYDSDGIFNGSFGGLVNGAGCIGVWRDKDGGSYYPFQLWLANAPSAKNRLTGLNPERMGEYHWKYRNEESYGAWLNIPVANDDCFVFRIEGYWRDHNGMIDGVAFYSDDSHSQAVFINPDDGLKMDFLFKDGRVQVTSNDLISNYAGVNVSLTGNFQKQEQKIN